MALLFLLFVVYASLGLFGFGNDCDSYLMMRSGQTLLQGGGYQISRPPGYFVPELIIGGASLLGGHALSNFISSLLGVGALFLFWRLIRSGFTRANAGVVTALVGLNPTTSSPCRRRWTTSTACFLGWPASA